MNIVRSIPVVFSTGVTRRVTHTLPGVMHCCYDTAGYFATAAAAAAPPPRVYIRGRFYGRFSVLFSARKEPKGPLFMATQINCIQARLGPCFCLLFLFCFVFPCTDDDGCRPFFCWFGFVLLRSLYFIPVYLVHACTHQLASR